MAWTRKYYLKNNYLTSRSKFHEGHFGTGTTALCKGHMTYCYHLASVVCKVLDFNLLLWSHLANWNRTSYECSLNGTGTTALWSCIHIPNIIDLSGKKKKLWSGQASLRSSRSRSGRSGRWMFIEWFPTKLVLFQKGVFPCYIWILIMSPLQTKGDILV
jgi:hypothetical protein